MRIKKAVVGVAVLAAVAVTPVLAASTADAAAPAYTHGWACYGYGTGATHNDAYIAAREDMVGNVTVGQWVYTYGQFPDGSWWEQIAADCVEVR
jgi:hypothetical protein